MTFSHRNGETEPPTEPGWYWFEGAVRGTGPDRHLREVVRVLVQVDINGVTKNQITFDHHRANPYERVKDRWWGPITPPWKSK